MAKPKEKFNASELYWQNEARKRVGLPTIERELTYKDYILMAQHRGERVNGKETKMPSYESLELLRDQEQKDELI